ncbi:MED6-domain-containing protein [Obba rivulosa]|uniref:Mediator of RNA polymerase II transcription subunit 6 n=1 Tax=Obba rivulosa TaxID=1052685 RepID=A0A8E2DVJ5_9APHY|nr:MED6-domain-containing protein [Obba rivulosa]
MDPNDLRPLDDWAHRFFIWHEWLQVYGPLTNENVFEYFATSMFYDKQSNNQVLRMQTMHTGVPLQNEAEELKRFTGIEFAVVHSEPPNFFIIHKRERLSPEEVRPLAVYFITNNRIYQAPDLYTLISNRLLTSLHALQSSLDILRSHRPVYTPRTGFAWPIAEPASKDSKKRGLDEDTQPAEDIPGLSGPPQKRRETSSPERQENSLLLLNAMRTTAIHANQSFIVPSAVSESSVPETPAPAAGPRASVTPAPNLVRGVTPKRASNAPTPQEPPPPAKGAPGAGKKKKKRTATLPTPMPT